ncbi:MAG: sporulation membrane protein YtaF [Defluviitaleaceae bacterium]|nr:sporulation membrane protein YtaF [Defluviitaleaceae bacterium]
MFAIIEAAILASSLSIDAFAAGFAYGSKKIRIPALSAHIINFICCATVGIAMFLGHWLKPHLPENFAEGIAFIVLLTIGLIKLLDGIVKSLIRKHTGIDKAFKFSIFDVRFVLRMYADPEIADVDASARLSPAEAVALAVSISLDGMAVGFAAALAGVNPWALLTWSLIINFAALVLGRRLGHKLADKIPFNISWVAGIVLIGLAISQLF